MLLRRIGIITLLLPFGACQDLSSLEADGERSHAAAATDLLLSEYVEGSGNNKAIEIFNGTGSSIDLADYQIRMYFNGSSAAGTTVSLAGTVAPGDVHVVVHAQAGVELLALADQVSSSSFFNGDDAIELAKDGVAVDVFGQIGVDPGSSWGTPSTVNNTLRRDPSVSAGDPVGDDAFDPGLEWIGSSQDDFGDLGFHGGSGGDDSGDDSDDSTDTDDGGDSEPLDLAIHEIQSDDLVSPYVGQPVRIDGVVVAVFQAEGELSGFFLQEQDDQADGDPATSEGIFVDHATTAVAVGDRVEAVGTVAEVFQRTTLEDANITVLEHGQSLPSVATVSLPLAASLDELERFEGMRVKLPQTLTVSENYDLARYGQLWLSSGRLFQPTNLVTPGPDAATMQAANDLSRILLDDGNSGQNPDPVVFPAPALSASHTLRSGSTVSGIEGVLEFSFSAYRVLPTTPPQFEDHANPRTTQPDLAASRLRVASFNVLNYFNGDGLGGGFPTSRGATTATELARQRDKIVAAMVALDADIIGVMEIENDGYARQSAIADLVAGLNAASSASYAYVDPEVAAIGTDEIALGLLYRVDTVAPYGNVAVLDSTIDPRFDDSKNRPALAQSFEEVATGEILTVAVNHLKSKGSACDDAGDPDLGDGQGNCSGTRTLAALALADWLATDPTASNDPDVLIIGDLNAYAMEDPIMALRDVGYTDLLHRFAGNESAYSYVFMGQAGYLDHALANASLNGQVVDTAAWHVNADEPRALDYNEEFKSPAQVASFYAPDAYRASDHDPVVVGLDLGDSGDAAPSVALLAPRNGAVVENRAVIRVRATDAEDAAGSLFVEYRVDDGDYEPLRDYSQRRDEYLDAWYTSRLRRGFHVLTVRATDSAGNVTQAEPIWVLKWSRWWGWLSPRI